MTSHVLGNRLSWVGMLAAAAVAASAPARADFVSTASGSAITYSDEYVATSATTYSTDSSGVDYLLSVPGQYSFTRSFSAPQASVLGTSSVGNYAFQDSYVFQVGGSAAGNVLTASLSLPPTFALSDLQFRLYQITSGTTAPVVGGSISAGTGPVVAVQTLWQGETGVDNAAMQATFSGLQSGSTYVLDIAATSTGNSGGLYVGSLNLTAVPLPAGLWLMISGLAGVLGLGFNRKIEPIAA